MLCNDGNTARERLGARNGKPYAVQSATSCAVPYQSEKRFITSIVTVGEKLNPNGAGAICKIFFHSDVNSKKGGR